MFASGTVNLSEEQRQRLHPDFIANERAYLRMREQLLQSHRGQWVAVAADRVLAAGDRLWDVMDAGAAAGSHAYIARVGAEDQTVFRVRRLECNYDTAYLPFPIPRAVVAFSNYTNSRSRAYPDAIPDTGADICLLPNSDCAALDLYSSPCLTGMSGGATGSPAAAVFYKGNAEIDGIRTPALIQPVSDRGERIIGRDVLNFHRVTFDGLAQKVIFGV